MFISKWRILLLFLNYSTERLRDRGPLIPLVPTWASRAALSGQLTSDAILSAISYTGLPPASCAAQLRTSGLSSFICPGSEREPAADPEHTAPRLEEKLVERDLLLSGPAGPEREQVRHGFEDSQREHRSDVRQKPSGFSTWHQKSQGRWGKTSTRRHPNHINTSHVLMF